MKDMGTWFVVFLIAIAAGYRFLREGSDGVTPMDLAIGTSLAALVTWLTW